MRINLKKARPLLAGYAVNGVCETDPRVLTQINLARERLMKKPTRWKGMVQRFVFNLLGGCLTLPREIQTIEGAVICDTPFAIRNQWFEVIEGGPGRLSGCSCLNILHDRGDNHATFVDLPAPRRIRVYGDIAESAAARVLVQGFDENGNRVQTYDETVGGYVDGEYISINPKTPPEPNTSVTKFLSVDGVQKPATKGFVRLYAVTGTPTEDSTAFDDTTFVGSETPIDVGAITMAEAVWSGTGGDLSWKLDIKADRAAGDFKFAFMLSRTIIADTHEWRYSDSGIEAGTPYNFPPVGAIVRDSLGRVATVIASGLKTAGTPNIWFFTVSAFEAFDPLTGADSFAYVVVNDVDTVTLRLYDGSNNLLATIQQPLSLMQDQTDFAFTGFNVGGVTGLTLTLEGMDTLAFDEVTTHLRGAYTIIREYTAGEATTQTAISILHPDDESPSYRRYQVTGFKSRDGCPPQIMIMAVLRYLPVTRETDFLVIENIGALQHMLLALRYERDGNPQKAIYHEGKAEFILKQELENFTGDAAIGGASVQLGAFAPAEIENLL